ncbi:MAG: hypothetical protein QOK37_1589 [Thermoanaerobaculia bacterium]|nr:hypothetical protein [Thermoanaerobaculia bacterium]
MQTSQTRIDRAGAAVSILCAIHCLATPLILVSLPAAAKHSETAETWIAGISLLIGLSAIRASFRRNGALLPRIGIGAGLAAIIGSRLLLHGPAETVLVFTGAGSLVTAHLFNCGECRHRCVSRPRERSRQSSSLVLMLVLFLACGVTTTASAQSTGAAPATTMVVEMARTFAGFPYRLGGDSPKGLDCSALVQRAFRVVGVALPRTAARQFKQGCAVAREELIAGDLVFFHGGRLRGISHVGIYIGGGHFVHAARHGVAIASLNATHWARRFAGARRLIEEAPAAVTTNTNLCIDAE